MSLKEYIEFIDLQVELISQHKSKIEDIIKNCDCSNVRIKISEYFQKLDKPNLDVSIKIEQIIKNLTETEKIIANDYLLKVTERITLEYKNIIDPVLKQCDFDNFTPPRRSRLEKKYDQIVKGNVKIIKIKNNHDFNYKISFIKIGKFLQYQVFDKRGVIPATYMPNYDNNSNHPQNSKDAQEYIKNNPDKIKTVNVPINDDRDVFFKNSKQWVLLFNILNNIQNFTPTAVIEIGYKKYVCVIKRVKINKNDKVTFYISTKEIHLNNKLNKIKSLKKIPTGKYKNVRFDIDSSYTYGGTTEWCPIGSSISTTFGSEICYCQSYCNKPSYEKYGGVCYGGCVGTIGIGGNIYSEYLVVYLFACYINYPVPFNRIGFCDSYAADFEWINSNGVSCTNSTTEINSCIPATFFNESNDGGTPPPPCYIASGNSWCCPTDNCNAFDCGDNNC